MEVRALGILCALASAAAWAVGAILYRRAGEDTSAPSLNLVKSLLALLPLAAITLVVSTWRGSHLDSRSVALLSLSGVLGITLGDTFFFRALQLLGAHLLVLLTMVGQFLVVLLAVTLLGESPTRAAWIGIVLAIGGVTLAVLPRFTREDARLTRTGLLYGLLATACMSIGLILTKKGIENVPALHATTIRTASGVFGMTVWALISGNLRGWLAPFGNARLLKRIALAVLVVSLGGLWLGHVAIKNVEVSIASTLLATEPLFVLPLAVLFLREQVGWKAIVGAIAAFSGISFICLG